MANLPAVVNAEPINTGQSLSEGMVATLNLHTKLLIGSNILLGSIADGVGTMKDAIEDSFKGSNLDSGTVQGNVQKKEDDSLAAKFGSMLDSLEDAFSNLSTTKKSMLGIAALIGAIAFLNTYAEELVEKLAPILKFIKEKLIPALQELNAIILDAPGGYWTLLSGIGLSTLLWEFFGVGGKIAGLFTKVVNAIKNIKVVDLIDDLNIRKATWGSKIRAAFWGKLTGLFGRIGRIFTSIVNAIKGVKVVDLLDDLNIRKVTWGSRIRAAFMGRLTGLFGRIGGIFTSIGTSIRAMGTGIIDDLAKALKNLTPTWAQVLKNRIIGGNTIYPIVKGGGKNIGIVGRVSQSVEKIATAIKNLNPFKGLGASLKTLSASWKLALSTALFGSQAATAARATSVGAAATAGAKVGVLGAITNAITRIALIIKGIFTPASILGRFTTKIKGIFAIIGKALGFVSKMTGLTAFLKLGLSLGRAIPIVGQIIMVLVGIFSFIKGAIEGFKTGGILGAIKGGLIGLYDGLVGSFLNLMADIIGWVFKKLGFKRFGEWFSNLDFSFDSIMNGIIFVVDKVRYLMWWVEDKIKGGWNWFADKISGVPGFGWVKKVEQEEFVSLKTDLPPEEAMNFDAKDNTFEAPTATKIDVKSFDANQVANIDYSNAMDATSLSPQFAEIVQTPGVSTEEAGSMVSAMLDPTEAQLAEKAASEAEIARQAEAMAAAEMKRLELLADEEFARTGGAVTVYDTSSRSTQNLTTQVSNALSVDASDLVAAKLNLMLPAFN